MQTALTRSAPRYRAIDPGTTPEDAHLVELRRHHERIEKLAAIGAVAGLIGALAGLVYAISATRRRRA